MVLKTPPLSVSAQDTPDEDIVSRPASSIGSRHSQLLGRIADALQVPQAALYQPPNAVTPGRGTDGEGATDLDAECTALLNAFRRVYNPEFRRRLLALVQATAERT